MAFPVASPESSPAEFTVMVRNPEDCQPKALVTSLTEPSLNVANAFSWVVLPMVTTGADGVIVSDWSVAARPLLAGWVALSACVSGETMLGLTFPIDPKLKPKVKEEIQATVSQLPLEENDTVLSYINFFSKSRAGSTSEPDLLFRITAAN